MTLLLTYLLNNLFSFLTKLKINFTMQRDWKEERHTGWCHSVWFSSVLSVIVVLFRHQIQGGNFLWTRNKKWHFVKILATELEKVTLKKTPLECTRRASNPKIYLEAQVFTITITITEKINDHTRCWCNSWIVGIACNAVPPTYTERTSSIFLFLLLMCFHAKSNFSEKNAARHVRFHGKNALLEESAI